MDLILAFGALLALLAMPEPGSVSERQVNRFDRDYRCTVSSLNGRKEAQASELMAAAHQGDSRDQLVRCQRVLLPKSLQQAPLVMDHLDRELAEIRLVLLEQAASPDKPTWRLSVYDGDAAMQAATLRAAKVELTRDGGIKLREVDTVPLPYNIDTMDLHGLVTRCRTGFFGQAARVVIARPPRATHLSAGICKQGGWQWLR